MSRFFYARGRSLLMWIWNTEKSRKPRSPSRKIFLIERKNNAIRRTLPRKQKPNL